MDAPAILPIAPLRRVYESALLIVLLGVLGFAAPASAHPVPFSYVDVHVDNGGLELTLVAHIFDLAHELGVDPPEQLLLPAVFASRSDAMIKLVQERLALATGNVSLGSGVWSPPAALIERQSIRFHARYESDAAPGVVSFTARLFPYDPTHQTFVNFYEGGALTSQAILDAGHPQLEYYVGSRQGAAAVIRKFVPAGMYHILIGPDHLLFLFGLLLLGGSVRRLLLVTTSFTVAHSITLSLAALNVVAPPARIIEPVIALSIVCVGVDNLMVGPGRDIRAWIAFAFGLIHGFGFASVLREMGLPGRALGWSLFSFNFGVEIGQLLVVVLVACVLAWLYRHSETTGRRLAFAGSLAVIAMGAFWFIQRVFFPGGIA